MGIIGRHLDITSEWGTHQVQLKGTPHSPGHGMCDDLARARGSQEWIARTCVYGTIESPTVSVRGYSTVAVGSSFTIDFKELSGVGTRRGRLV